MPFLAGLKGQLRFIFQQVSRWVSREALMYIVHASKMAFSGLKQGKVAILA
jgi:hypothetical protein